MNRLQAPAEPRDNPYFGLDYYEERFSAWFFGRETERSKIITDLRGARLTLLHADSGVGKSSLLRAGVASRLQEVAGESFQHEITAADIPAVFGSWTDDPVPKLIEAIGVAIEPFLPPGHPQLDLPRDRLDLAIETAAEAVNASLIVILDQFEEYFLYCAREPTQFAHRLPSRVDVPSL